MDDVASGIGRARRMSVDSIRAVVDAAGMIPRAAPVLERCSEVRSNGSPR